MTDDAFSGFDGRALYRALDEQRAQHGLSWTGVADALWDLSAELNGRRGDHPISPSTLTNIRQRGGTSCQHALFMLRWLDRTPESFVTDPVPATDATLPPAGPDRRLRWHLHATARRPRPGLAEALGERRSEMQLTWGQLATRLGCSPNQLSGIAHARYAVGMRIAMAVTQWLGRPAADFVYAASW